jgi:hypothetical protein
MFDKRLRRFVRTIIVARSLSSSDLSAAVALTAFHAICDVITDDGLDKFILGRRSKAHSRGGFGAATSRRSMRRLQMAWRRLAMDDAERHPGPRNAAHRCRQRRTAKIVTVTII